MHKLINGLHHFQSEIFQSHKDLFESLSKGQHPEVLFITCSDSRIDPSLITQTNPGDLFILRNAGNIVPAFGASNGGEGATIEYAVYALGVKDIVVCGHTACGAMGGLLHPEKVEKLTMVKRWLAHAEVTKTIVAENYGKLDLTDEQLLNVSIQENVLVQLENLKTHPSVATRLAQGRLNLHAWVYKFQTGEVFAYKKNEGQFVSLKEAMNGSTECRPRLTTASLM